MASLFRGALNLLGGEGTLGAQGEHELVGSDLEFRNGLRLRVRSVIAEGGFAVVLAAQDNSGKWFAVKRQLANDRESETAINREIGFLEQLSGHPNIMKYIAAAKPQGQQGSRREFLIVTEMCSGGSVVDLLKVKSLNPDQIMKIFYGTCRAVQHMHNQPQPITHRDIKVENLLFDARGILKLCDFGSATIDIQYPNDSWSALQRTQLEEEFQRHTTPMYRAPEILDTYSNFPVGPSQDIWALGCVLFYMCYRRHPFEDSAKLRIINAKYSIPQDDEEMTMFIPLIQTCLRPNPVERPQINDLVERAQALAAAMGCDASGAVSGITCLPAVGATAAVTQGPSPISTSQPAPPRPPPPRTTENESGQSASAVFGALKGQGLSLFRSMKDRGSAITQTIQSTYGSAGPDVTFITSRLALAPHAEVPEALAAQAEDALRAYCTELGRPFLIVNISYRRLAREYPTRPVECLLASQNPSRGAAPAPTLNQMIQICRGMIQFLCQHPNGCAVLYGSQANVVAAAAAALLYARVLPRLSFIFQLIEARRPNVQLPPSLHAILDRLSTVVTNPQEAQRLNRKRSAILDAVCMEPTPLFNRAATGCRPVVEIFCDSQRVFVSETSYERLRAFENPEGAIEIALGAQMVSGDVTLVVSHASWSKIQNRMSTVVMWSSTMHTSFMDVPGGQLVLHRHDLDLNPEGWIPENFRVLVNLRLRDSGASTEAFPTYSAADANPSHLVENDEEYEYISRNYDMDGGSKPQGATAAPERPAPPKVAQPVAAPVPTVDFFNELDWSQAPGTIETSGAIQAPVIKQTAADDLFSFEGSSIPSGTTKNVSKTQMEAEDYERMYGIRVSKTEESDDADKYRFDCDRPQNTNLSSAMEHPDETPILGESTPVAPVAEMDMLGLGASTSASTASTATPVVDPFAEIFGPSVSNTTAVGASHSGNDLLGDWGAAPTATAMHRNISAPSFNNGTAAKPAAFDPFAQFLSQTTVPPVKQGSAPSSGSSTPKPSRPNYTRSAFDELNPKPTGQTANKANANDIFGDILSSQGFTSSAKNATRTMADLRREDDIRELDPVQIKIRDWIQGKEKNIRALLGSLNDVLWDGANKWNQPSMAELLSADQVKKSYRRACIVVHPDKQTGQPHEDLARAIFTELNDAWNAFDAAGCPSL